MHLGGFLVLLGTIFAVIALLVGDAQFRGRTLGGVLLALGVILIGIGVLVGASTPHGLELNN